MPRKKPRPAGTTPPPIAPSKTSHLFSARKPNERAPITHERVAEDIEAFRKAGGKIEVLGVTRSLLRVGIEPGDAAPAMPAKPAPTRRR